MLWIALSFPHLALDQFSRVTPESLPLAVTSGEGRGERVLDANPAAASYGVEPGIKPSSAYGLCPELLIKPRDQVQEQRALASLADWAMGFTSAVSLAEQALLLEVAGSLRLFNGLDALCRQLEKGLAELGYQASLAVAPSRSAAELLSRVKDGIRVESLAELKKVLSPVALRHLQLDAKVLEGLAALGARKIGDCLALPRAALARRMGHQVHTYFDRLLGERPDPVTFHRAAPHFHRCLLLPAEAETLDGINFALRRLLLELQGYLSGQAASVTGLQLGLRYRDQRTSWLDLQLLRPGRDGEHWFWLLQQQLEQIELVQAVTELELKTAQIVKASAQNLSLFGAQRDGADRALLLERLQARLGVEAAYGLAISGDHRPEQSWYRVAPGTQSDIVQNRPRPGWLLENPERLLDRGGSPVYGESLELLQGPERIESGWWDGQDSARDYYIARHPQGALYWVYRNCRDDRCWYLQGVFG